MKRKKGFFSISAVAKMFSVHQQTVRMYEREGLLVPKRSEGNTRLFSEDDVNKLEEIIYLTHKLGINIAGVQMILKLQKQIKKLQTDMNKIFDETKEDLTKQKDVHSKAVKEATKRLMLLRQDPAIVAENPSQAQEWHIEYEDE